MRLSEFKWEGMGTLEELIIWGLNPMALLLDYMDMLLDDEMDITQGTIGGKLLGIKEELLNKVIDLEETIDRFIRESRHFDRPEELKTEKGDPGPVNEQTTEEGKEG
jgi:hypothetical protein